MHEIISFLKDAVTRGPSAGVNGCYVIRDGAIYCRNLSMQAGVEMESELPFTVPAEEFDAALKRMKEIQSLTINEGSITVKSGRLKSTIKCNDDMAPPMPEMPEDWIPFPPGLIDALELAKPFVGDRPGTNGIRLMNDRITAMSSSAGIDIVVEGLQLAGQVLLPMDVAAFLTAQGAPNEYSPSEGAIMFRWDDGRWLRAQLLNDKFPHEMVEKIFEMAGDKTPVPITKEWREGVADIAALCDDVFLITEEGFKGNKGAAAYDIEFNTRVGKKHTSSWNVKFMQPIFDCADAWNPAKYPEATNFKGPNLRGVVMGYRR